MKSFLRRHYGVDGVIDIDGYRVIVHQTPEPNHILTVDPAGFFHVYNDDVSSRQFKKWLKAAIKNFQE